MKRPFHTVATCTGARIEAVNNEKEKTGRDDIGEKEK